MKATWTSPSMHLPAVQVLQKASSRIEAGDPFSIVFHPGPVRKGTDDSGTTYGPHSVLDLRNDESIEHSDSRSSRIFTKTAKWTAVATCAAVITLLVGYLVANRWYDNRIVNPYGMGYGAGIL